MLGSSVWNEDVHIYQRGTVAVHILSYYCGIRQESNKRMKSVGGLDMDIIKTAEVFTNIQH